MGGAELKSTFDMIEICRRFLYGQFCVRQVKMLAKGPQKG